MTLFSLFLESSISAVISSAVGAIVSVVSKCPVCSQRDNRIIPNRTKSQLDCSNCHIDVEQFTNACNFTVNSETSQIGLVGVKLGELQIDIKRDYYRDGFLWIRKNYFDSGFECHFPYEIRVDGLKNRSLAFELSQLPFPDGDLLDSQATVLATANDSDVTTGVISMNPRTIGRPLASGRILACDLTLKSEFGDVLFEGRTLLQHTQ